MRGLKEFVVDNYEDCIRLLRLGEYHRHYAETRMNHQSSRSHTLFRLHVESVATTTSPDGTAGTNVIRESVLVSPHSIHDSAELRRPSRQREGFQPFIRQRVQQRLR